MRQTLPLVVVMNAVPLLGVVFWGWDLVALLLAFWAETAVIGLAAMLQMVAARGTDPGKKRLSLSSRLMMLPFFCLHFGGFMAVHGAFVVWLSGAEPESAGHGLLTAAPELAWASDEVRIFLLAALAHHGLSTVVHHFRNGERDRHGPMFFMMRPYRRVVVQHLALLAGAFATQLVGQGMAVLVCLVVIKTVADVAAHRRVHRAAAAG